MSETRVFCFTGNCDQSLGFIDWLEEIGYTFRDAFTFDITPDQRPVDSFDGLRRLARDLKDNRKLFLNVTLPFEDWVLARLKFGKR